MSPLRFLLFAFLTLALFPQLSLAQDRSSQESKGWPAFRGDGTSITTASNLPTEWNDNLNVAWKIDLPGFGQSSPVVWGDRIFVTTMLGEMKDVPKILCLGLADGKVLWQQDFKSTQKIQASNYVTRSSPTPVVDAKQCYAFFESGELIATDHDGSIQWQRSLVDEYGEFKGNHGIGSSLAITDKHIIVLVAHEGPSYLLAVDKSTGKNAWKTDLDPKVSWSSPAVTDNIVVLSVSGTVQGFDLNSGKRIWSVDDVEGNTVASATIHRNVAFIGSGERSNNFAVRFDTSGDSNEIETVWQNDEVTSSFGSPLYHNGQVYFVSKKGVAYAVDASTGATTWKERLSSSCWASPIAASDKIYFFTKDGETNVYSTDPTPELIATNSLDLTPPIYGVAIADSRFIIRTGTQLTCLANQGQSKTDGGKGPSNDDN